MIIAFDTFFLTERFRRVGIYEYAKNLLCEFQKLADQDSSASIRYFVSSGYSDEFLPLERSLRIERVKTVLLRHHRLWRMGLLNYAAARAGADLVFCPAPTILPFGVLPVAVTIHDAIPSRLPSSMVGMRTAYTLRSQAWIAAKSSQRILTDSEHSKKDLVELYDLPPDKVSVVYLGYNCAVFNSSPPDADARRSLLAKFDIRGPYIVHHGMVQLRKNLVRLIDAYSKLMNRSSFRGLELVLAGAIGRGSDQILQAANSIAHGRVIFTGPLPDDELALVIKGAALSVIPSLYEGFCLPMLEAMASGVPTVAANNSCIPEISGGILRYFDPLSEEDMEATITDVLEHTDLQTALIRNGLKRASEFSWRRCALETLAVLTGSQVPAPSKTLHWCKSEVAQR